MEQEKIKMKKESIGMLVILGGVAIIGFFWFKRNKPQLAKSQLADLTTQSNSLTAGAQTIDKPFEYSQEAINSAGSNPYTTSTVTINNFTPEDIKAIQTVTSTIPDVQANILSQIAQNLQNSSESINALANLHLENIDLTNIKIK